MINPDTRPACSLCENTKELDFEFSMAFQPIVDYKLKSVFAYEALVRGINGEPAGAVLKNVNPQNIYQFDQECRVKAVELASRLGVDCDLSINFIPGAVYNPQTCIRRTIKAAKDYNFPINRIIFEVVESEEVRDRKHLVNIFKEYKATGFQTALDDFGEGYSGLNNLIELEPDIIKLDMALIRDIDSKKKSQIVVKSIFQMCSELGIKVIAEGVETIKELEVLLDIGINYFQGYLFAKPTFEALPEVSWP